MDALLNLAPFLSDRARLKPLSESEFEAKRVLIEAELAPLRSEIRHRFPQGLRSTPIYETLWLMDRLQLLSEATRCYLAYQPTWI